jgi:hypothetical protein
MMPGIECCKNTISERHISQRAGATLREIKIFRQSLKGENFITDGVASSKNKAGAPASNNYFNGILNCPTWLRFSGFTSMFAV